MTPVASPPRPQAAQPRSLSVTGGGVIGAATAVLVVVAALTVDNFGRVPNLRALLLSVSLIGIIAVGLSLITIVGKVFTLSIPAQVALTTILFASTLELGAWTALLIAVVAGTAIGAVQGLVVGRFDSDPIITTIAASAIMYGLGQLLTSGRTVVGSGDVSLFNTNLGGVVPFQTAVFVVVTAALWWWHRHTVAGRLLTLVGLNDRAAGVSGTRSWPHVTLAFAVAGAATGLAGALLSAQSGQGTLQLGQSFGFDAIVAVVVGGIAIKGGIGNPLGAALGALFVGLLGNVLALMGLSYETQLVVKGLLVLGAVTVAGITSARSGRG